MSDIKLGQQMYPNMGKCIYCGSTDNLTDEHIVPVFLGGEGVLHDASCDTCSDITKRFEGDVGQGMFGQMRTLLGMRTRRKRERPTSLPLKMRYGEHSKIEQVRLEDYPSFGIALPQLPPARLFFDFTDHGPPIAVGVYTLPFHPKNHQERADRLMAQFPGSTGYDMTATIAINSFVRMLAKIAHAMCVAELGYGSFQPVLLPLILGVDTRFALYVGERRKPLPFSKSGNQAFYGSFFTITTTPVPYLGLGFRLFEWAENAPAYSIIVGPTTQDIVSRVADPSGLPRQKHRNRKRTSRGR